MSTASVRAALQAFFSNPQIPGLMKVHTAPPYWADGSEWDLRNAPTEGASAIGALHLIEESESRITVPVLTGQKAVEYKVGLMLFYQFLMPSNTLTPVPEAAWADPLDAIIDGVKARLRSDPNCGLPSTIFEAGQSHNDLRVQRDLPRRLPGKVLAWNVLEFKVTEIVTA